MSEFEGTRVRAQVGGKEIIMETGKLAKQANGSVWIQCGGTVVLVTACNQALDKDFGFFPLTVEYSEKMYAAGMIPGSYFRREMGRPSEGETLISRLIDRPLRPLFPEALKEEVQILATVLSADEENLPDVLALTGASAAVSISSIPFEGPVAGARIGRVDGEFILNPSPAELEKSELDFVIAASRDAVVMVEGEADFVPEAVVADALEWGHKEIQPLIEAQEELMRLCGKEKAQLPELRDFSDLKTFVADIVEGDMQESLKVADKMERREAKNAVREKAKAAVIADDSPFVEDEEAITAVSSVLGDLEKEFVRKRIKNEGMRIDGRDTETVRPINIDMHPLPRPHGSVVFTRGETQALVAATLGSTMDEQRMDSLAGNLTKNFMFHYNFPPFSVGETRMVRVSRREIGHGALAEKALKPVLPSSETFPYTLRLVSETLESNGSSSMAAVCGGCLALMDAGVPISAPVAGVAMGLIKEDDDFIILTDILGDEDALGDMDFKIAGTAEGLTAVQMDIKVTGISMEIMTKALEQAKKARLHILGEMEKAQAAPRAEISENAPQYCKVKVDPDVIRHIIGPGGKNIKEITALTDASVDIEDSGDIAIFAPTMESMNKAKEMVLAYDQKPELGKNYEDVTVVKVLDFGAIVQILPNVDALVHVSQLDTKRVEQVSDFVKEGDKMTVKVIEINGDRVRASRRVVLQEEEGIEWEPEQTNRRGGGGGGRGRPRGGDRDRRDDRSRRGDDRRGGNRRRD